MNVSAKIIQELKNAANQEKAKILQGFFKCGKGEYGEGDLFLGVSVPEVRRIAKKYTAIEFLEVQKLLANKLHEVRQAGLFVLVKKFEIGSEKEKQKVYRFYLQNLQQVNNWDLVDLTAPKIIGAYLVDKNAERKILYKLAKSKNLWEKRIAIISTFAFIRQNYFSDTLAISEIFLAEKHDLMHKAVGWMLREVGKRNQEVEEEFLRRHYQQMPRTMLRYAIEKFAEDKRQRYLQNKI
jgi:3-methyladenine DNA glycosylase AlkD